jgi:tetratricopeptide (TPR) repeat protein
VPSVSRGHTPLSRATRLSSLNAAALQSDWAHKTVKTLLDKLMARQAKLLGALHDDDRLSKPGADSSAARPLRLSAPERAQRIAREQEALDDAAEPLARGALEEAVALLEPWAAAAQGANLLTTLARLKWLQGDVAQAHQCLQQAEHLDPGSTKVARYMAQLLEGAGRHHEAILHWRR